jgi:uncharacterized membrane protein YfcA
VTLLQAIGLTATGVVAGTASAMAGGASILSFPVLVAMGVPPLTANVTNTVGLSPTVVGAAFESTPELRHERRRLVFLVGPAVLGAIAGGALLLSTPADTFEAIVPALIAGSCLLMLLQPRLVRHTLKDQGDRPLAAWASTFATGVYTGYFGAASGVMFLGLMGLFATVGLHRLNAVKNILVGIANATAMVIFVVLAPVRWPMAIALALGSVVGGATGARLVRRVPAPKLRAGIALVGLAVAVRLAL